MIYVHRLNGSEFVINLNLIETIEANPDTVITLNNDRKFVVKESIPDIINQIIVFQRNIFQFPFHPETKGDS